MKGYVERESICLLKDVWSRTFSGQKGLISKEESCEQEST